MKPNKTQFCQAIINWYHRHGRHNLPWQKNTNAYKVWVSEIMLQQTQVNTVIPYFNAFMQKFPSVKQLATASLDDVLTLWSGLGYYARARNLHKTGQIIHENHHGRFPQNLEGLIQLPGIGRSTAGAILSLGMKKSASILDGNVKRVLTRAHAISDWPGKSHVLKALWQISEAYTPKKHCPEYNQAMMDIGSMICTRNKPNCTLCPINKFCMAHQTNSTHLYPTKKAKAKRITKKTKMLIIRNSQGQVLLKKARPLAFGEAYGAFQNALITKTLPHCAINLLPKSAAPCNTGPN